MRQCIRDPVDVPVEILASGAGTATGLHTHDISLGGLAFQSEFAVPVGSIVAVRIPCVQPPCEAHAQACRATPPGTAVAGACEAVDDRDEADSSRTADLLASVAGKR